MKAAERTPQAHIDRFCGWARRRRLQLVDSASDEHSDCSMHREYLALCSKSRWEITFSTTTLSVGVSTDVAMVDVTRVYFHPAVVTTPVDDLPVCGSEHSCGGRRDGLSPVATDNGGVPAQRIGCYSQREGDSGIQADTEGPASHIRKEATEYQECCDGGGCHDPGDGRKTGGSKRPRERSERSKSPPRSARQVPVTKINTIPTYGSQSLSHTNISAMKPCGAQFFRIAPRTEHHPMEGTKRGNVVVGVQRYPQRPPCVSSDLMGRHAALKCPAMILAEILPQVGAKCMSFGKLRR